MAEEAPPEDNLPTNDETSSSPIQSPPPTATDEKPPMEAVKSATSKVSKEESRKSILQQASKKSIAEKTKTPSKSSTEEKSEVRMETVVQRDIPLTMQESKKSMLSLGGRASRDISKDLFARRKSSRSIGKAVGSIISFRRGSIAEYFDRQKTAKYMNTYKLDSEKPFNVDKVEKILKEVLMEALDNLTYDADKVPKQAKWASSMIRAKVKEQEYDRYKLICNVTIGEKRSQDMFATYRFLWDAERDKHASYVYENMYVYAIAVCFGIYYE
ncbi:Tctex-1 family [Popillia japonica]|uniref:Tctex-1 family n=1 Tax=Popillia japonica TaxID=7064 RepID=A0AAW1L411_POPJA